MKEQEIRANIAEKLGISKLNEVQATMADVSEPLAVLTAPTGAGKTLAFAIAALKAMTPPEGCVQTVVVAPSRELVLQIYEVIRPIATGYKTVAFYGGHSMQDEVNSLIMSPDIIISTPGRLVDHINRFQLKPGTRLHTLVLDEYDKALELGFADEMRRILRFFVAPEHIILTSATAMTELPDYFPRIQPRVIDFTSDTTHPRSRMHIVRVESPSRDKLDTLGDVIVDAFEPGSRIIVFVNHRESAERVHKALRRMRIPVGLYHGGLEQPDREKAIELLNNGTTPILVSTDLASRGLDIEAVDTVIHYHLPPSEQSWVHRNGRTARVDRQGNVVVITSEADNIPEYVEWDNDYYAPSVADTDKPLPASDVATLYLNAGKKEKISRGDIVGFLIAVGGMEAGEIGRIALRDHWALVGVPASRVPDILEHVAHQKIKGRKVKVTQVR